MKTLLLWLSTVALLTATGCAPAGDDAADSAGQSGQAAGSGHASAVLPFIADDYPRALAEARERGLPLFVEAWAPW